MQPRFSIRPALPRRAVGWSTFLLLFLTVATAAFAQTGTIVGRVFDSKTDAPLPFTNVSVLGTGKGTIAREDGSFVLANFPIGTYEVQASFMGYTTSKVEVTVLENRTVETTIRMAETSVGNVEEVIVTAERPLINVDDGATIRQVTADDIKELTVQPTLDSVVEQQAGVTKDRGKLHIRGGRSDETLYIVDGVQMRDILSGESKGGNAISARSVAEVNIITGGFDAKYGQALSGIVEAKLKEGSNEYHGYFGHTSDYLTDDWDVDLTDFQISGPLPFFSNILKPLGGDKAGQVTFFLNIAGDLSNGHLPSIGNFGSKLNSSYSDKFLGKTINYDDLFVPRGSNEWRGLFKASWKASPAHKFAVSVTKNLSFSQGFNDNDISQVNRNTNNYPWAWSKRLDEYYTVSQDRNSFSFTWNNTVRPTLLQQIKVTRFFASRHQDVKGQLWDEYDVLTDTSVDPADDTPYFRDAGQPTSYRDRYIRTWAVDWDWTKIWNRHDIRWGLHSQYEDVQYLSLDAASVDDDNPLGDEFDLFHVFPNTGALYLQDRLEFEGLVANIGLRYDYWFPGAQVDALYERQDRPTITAETAEEYEKATNSLFGNRFKSTLAPRIQVSHPISETSHLFFNYGHFSQRPAYFYVYAKSNSQSSEEFPNIGNPNLDPEISVQYELGVGHQLTADKAVKVSLYNKDIYDYPTSESLTLQDRTTRRSEFFIYRNLDYARSRGVEVELRKRRTDRMSWAMSYTFSNAKGKSSDPNTLKLVQQSGGDARETNLEEEYMWWNRPHKFTSWMNYAVPRDEEGGSIFGIPIPSDIRANVYLLLQSGRAYTPQDVFGSQTGLANSKNGPFDSTVNATIVKGFKVGGRRLELTIQGWNLLNRTNATEVDPATGEAWTPGEGTLGIDPADHPDNLDLSDQDLVDVTGSEVEVDPLDDRLQGLEPGTPKYEAKWEVIYQEELSRVASDDRRTIQAIVNRYDDPSSEVAPRHIRIGIGMEW